MTSEQIDLRIFENSKGVDFFNDLVEQYSKKIKELFLLMKIYEEIQFIKAKKRAKKVLAGSEGYEDGMP